MAIEKSYGPFDAPPRDSEELVEADAMPEESSAETLSMSLLGGKTAKPGDVVRIRVESVNEDDGTWQGAYDEGEPESSSLGNMMKSDAMKGGM